MPFNVLIHEERTKLLALMPPGAKTMLSAGCSGAWYFDWVATAYGPVSRHIGIELYSPQPAGLPTFVEWLPNSVAKMSGVISASVDLVFSGQNVEHLPPVDLLGFLMESNRVLANGKHLVIDSPNRSVTLAAGYIQPEHTLELTVPEICTMVELAGFEVTAVKGIWLCDRAAPSIDVTVIPADAVELERRKLAATDRPLESFIWWLEAVKIAEPNAEALRKFIDVVFEVGLPAFLDRRYQKQIGRMIGYPDPCIAVASGENGYVVYGPYIPLVAGRYEVSVCLRVDTAERSALLRLDVCSGTGAVTHASVDIPVRQHVGKGWFVHTLPFALDHYCTAVEARVLVHNASLQVRPKPSISVV